MSNHNPLYTIFLILKSDIKTVLIPQTLFAIASLFTAGFEQPCQMLLERQVIVKLVKAIIWILALLLIEDIANQRLPGSILEDSNNKPWRPFASKRLSHQHGQRMLLILVPGALVIGAAFGNYAETSTLLALIWMYNDLEGANSSMWWRAAVNTGGLTCFSAGVTAITAGPLNYAKLEGAVLWLLLTGVVIFTTGHAQDLPDMVGDSARNRQTIPLLYGQFVARVTLAIGCLLWSIICTLFWESSFLGSVPTLGLGVLIAYLTLTDRTQRSDEAVWKLYCFWLGTIYLLPLFP